MKSPFIFEDGATLLPRVNIRSLLKGEGKGSVFLLNILPVPGTIEEYNNGGLMRLLRPYC